jgi:hypothetical protein
VSAGEKPFATSCGAIPVRGEAATLKITISNEEGYLDNTLEAQTGLSKL